ncbi:hypothetical protein HB976_04485 [Yersinia mollaretii]|uniref:hypothetical protein n=1 Tax=Yersinia mollaretii TaxID=33060 RepID=UPI001427BF3F|nr:hypothetical protein [Yersinia mollaretii]MDA5534294.1 hypothetical protein [Yersinia mollaretii]NIL02222.1 hypothetical protein [Yersinia mollaretii]
MPKYKVFSEPSSHSLWDGEAKNHEQAIKDYIAFSGKFKKCIPIICDPKKPKKEGGLKFYVLEDKESNEEDYQIIIDAREGSDKEVDKNATCYELQFNNSIL